MSRPVSEQLDKILALADSNHDQEAIVAVRKARQILSRDGLQFSDLARAASSRSPARLPSRSWFSAGRKSDPLFDDDVHLRQQLDDLRAQIQTQDLQLDFWRRRARDLEHNAGQAHTDAERWKNLARETIERLWDIGQNLDGDTSVSGPLSIQDSILVSAKK